MEERRKSPRRAVHGEIATVSTMVNVQLLDVSLSGVLLQSDEPLEKGTEGSLSVDLDGSRFTADVRVQRAADSEVGQHLGARFVAVSPDRHRLIERFMGGSQG